MVPNAFKKRLLIRLYVGWIAIFVAAFLYCYLNSYLFPSGDLGLIGKVAWTVSRWGAWPLLLPAALGLYAALDKPAFRYGRYGIPVLMVLAASPLFAYGINMLFGYAEPLLVSFYRVLPAAVGGIVYFAGIAYRFSIREKRFSQEHGASKSGHLSLVSSTVQFETADEKFLKKLFEAIDANLCNSSFGVKELAAKMAMSRRQLLRKTGALVGQSPSEVLRNRRLEAARNLLEANADTVSQISYAVGFDSAANFTRLFKQKYGELPSVYRKHCMTAEAINGEQGIGQVPIATASEG